MLTLKLKNSVLKRYYIFDWYRGWFFGGFPQKCILCFPQTYWEVLLHWKVFSCRQVFCKTTVEISTKILKGVLQKRSRGLRELETCSAKLLRAVLLILTGVLPDCLEKPNVLTQNQHPCENQGLCLFPVRSWPSILGGKEMISSHWWQNYLQICNSH